MSETIVQTNEYRQNPQHEREQRGRIIAATKTIKRYGRTWRVPSQSGIGSYTVSVEELTCTCPDFETRRQTCKHIYAASYVYMRQFGPDGSVKETESLTVTRQTYRQDWHSYNAAQTEEKARFMALLRDLCDDVPQPEQSKGRPRLPMADMVYASAFKVYSGFSSRRFISDLREAQASGYIESAPHFNSVSNYLASPDMTPVLKELIALSSLPMRAIERDFAVDSSGFSTSRFARWYEKKYGNKDAYRVWVKAHLMVGVQTRIVTAVEVTDGTANDSPFLIPLLNDTAARFPITEVSADRGYLSRRNVAAIAQVGATPYMPFKSNTLVPSDESEWTRMYHAFALNRATFLAHYHKRSNVETAFHQIKAKFGDSVRSKGDVGQMNEVLTKVLCHNICVVIQATHELGLDATFCTESRAAAQKVLPFRA